MKREERYKVIKEMVMEELDETFKRIAEIDKEIDAILKEIRSLNPARGSLVYKWVKNKVGKKYWYWYLHLHTTEGTRSIYIGHWVPEGLMAGFRDRARLRYLQRKLKALRKERERLIEITKLRLKGIVEGLVYA